jgi:hypothetical protein
MTQHVPMDDWDSLQSEWRQAGGSASSQAAASSGLARARRARIVIPVIEGAVALTALGATAGALAHAAAAFEIAIGLVVGAAITLLWTRRVVIRVREHDADGLGSREYLTFLRGVRSQQARLAQFVWIVLSLELAFLVPWWERGSRVHPRTLTNVSSWLGMYLPIVMMVALLAWSIRFRRIARGELASIDKLSASYRDSGERLS